MNKYRDKLKITADILSVASRKAKKTQIMYQANLSYRLLCRYLNDVLEAGLVCVQDQECYALTTKGKEFLALHDEYVKRRKSLEKSFNHVNIEKCALEKMCANKRED